MGLYTIKRVLNNENNYNIIKEIYNFTKESVENKEYYKLNFVLDKFGRNNYDLVFYGVLSYFYDEDMGFSEVNKENLNEVLRILYGNKMELDVNIDKLKEEYFL